ncbi:MAG: chemotaxis signal transduction protein, partial [Cyclobacteriaceae bacterium]
SLIPTEVDDKTVSQKKEVKLESLSTIKKKTEAKKKPVKTPAKKSVAKPKDASAEKIIPKKITPKKVMTKTVSPEDAASKVIGAISAARKSKTLTSKDVLQRNERRIGYQQELKAIKNKELLLILFEIGNEYFAIEIDKAKEVVPTPSISELPNVSDHVKGVAQVRNRLVIFMDLAVRFGFENGRSKGSSSAYTMIIRHQSGYIGIPVNRVPQTFKTSGTQLKEVPLSVAMAPTEDNFIKFIGNKDGKLVYVLAIDDLINADRSIQYISERTTGVKKK